MRTGQRSFPLQNSDQRKTNRRTFITRTAGCTASLALLPLPGMITDLLAAKDDKSKEQIMKELDEKCQKYMMQYGTCSQASFTALNDQFQLKGDNVIRALKPFAGGLGGKQETCGAVSGSLLAMGIYLETGEQKMDVASMQYAAKFCDKVTEQLSSTRCAKIVEHQFGRPFNFQDPEDMKAFMAEASKGKCTEVVKIAVQKAAEIMLEKA